MKEKNVLVLVVVILLAAVIITNFDIITGKVIKKTGNVTSISVTPKTITAGEQIYVHIAPGERCAWRIIEILKVPRSHRITAFEKTAASSRYCKPMTVNYKTWSSWEPGEYYVSIKDIATQTWVGKDIKEAYFKIE